MMFFKGKTEDKNIIVVEKIE